jgi:hypothetical protein
MQILSTMETTSHPTSPEDAAAALEVARDATQAAYAPQPLPRWYTPTIATGVSGVWAVQDTHNNAARLVVSVAYAMLLGGTSAALIKAQGRRARVFKAPPALRANMIRSVLVLFTAMGSCFLLVWLLPLTHKWLWVAGTGFVAMIVGSQVAERSYKKAYERWKAAA